MFEKVSLPAQSRDTRRAKRMIWVAALFVGGAMSFGANAPQSSISATPEDPCLLTQSCEIRDAILQGQLTPEELRIQCDTLRERGVEIPECPQY